MDRILSFILRHYFQNILMAQMYRSDGWINFASEEFLHKKDLEPIGVWKGNVKQLTNEVHLEAPLYRLQFKLNSQNCTVASVLGIASKHIGHRELFQVNRNLIDNTQLQH